MATLTGNTIASTYLGVLSVSGAVGADTVEAVTDGAGTSTSLSLSQQRATITLGSGAADDFIVDGTTLVVEGDNNRVGIGTAAPDYPLHVKTTSGACNVKIEASAGGAGVDPALVLTNNGLSWSIYNDDTDDFLKFYDGGADVMVLDSTNNRVGIGIATPQYILHLSGASAQLRLVASSGSATATIQADAETNNSILSLNSGGASEALIHYDHHATPASQVMSFIVGDASTTAMTILGDGKVGIGASPVMTLDVVAPATSDTYIARLQSLTTTDTDTWGLNIDFSAAGADDETQIFMDCEDDTAVRFKIFGSGDYNSHDGGTINSDERLKENIVDTSSKLDDINKLKVRNYNFRENDKETGQKIHSGESASRKRIGFIAQEFEEVFPGLVKDSEIISAREAVEAKDAVLDEDGNVLEEAIETVVGRKQLIRKNLRAGALVPMLVKAIQELTAKVEALENNNQQGDSSNEQEQESAGSGDSGGDASSESSGEDSGGAEAGSSDSSGSASGASEAGESSSDDGNEGSGGSGSDSSDDSEGGSGEDDSGGTPSGEPSSEWTKDQLKAYMDDNEIAYNSGDTKDDLLDKITLAGEGPDEG